VGKDENPVTCRKFNKQESVGNKGGEEKAEGGMVSGPVKKKKFCQWKRGRTVAPKNRKEAAGKKKGQEGGAE